LALFDRREATGKWWIDHSLSLALGGLLALWMVATFSLGMHHYQSEQPEYPFWSWFWFEWFTSTLADVFGTLLIVLLSKRLYERGSAESKDPGEGPSD
jgi:hypothetical protein